MRPDMALALSVILFLAAIAFLRGLLKAVDADVFARHRIPPVVRDGIGLLAVILVIVATGLLIDAIAPRPPS
jgi:hypothetical protein